MRLSWLVLIIACFMAQPAALAGDGAPWLSWQSKKLDKHALTGKVWAAASRQFVAPEVLAAAAFKADFVLLGEVHDNPDHHRLQAWVIAEIVRQGRRPAVVFEMIRIDQDGALRAYLGSPGASAAGLGQALLWNEQGWPEWRNYQPVAEAAMAAKLPVKAGSPPREETRKVSLNGLSALPAETYKTFGFSLLFSDHLQKALLEDLFVSHCRMVPESALGPMASVQRLRDATLADSMIGAGDGGAVLIAGSGHVRKDRGVPWYLQRRAPQKTAVSVSFVEVKDGVTEPENFVPRDPNGAPAADFIWFTPAFERSDPCEDFKRLMNKK